MPVKGKFYQASGLMVYALAYGKAADKDLQTLFEQGRIQRVLTDKPARLKPLDRESLRLKPKEIANAQAVKIRLADDQKTIVLEVDASDKQPSVEVKAMLENLFYPYLIHSATLSAKLQGNGFSYPLPVSPETIAMLAPSQHKEVSVNFPIPHAQIPSVWSPSRLSSLGTQSSILADIAITLNQQRLQLDSAFVKKLEKSFPGDPISNVLLPPQEVRASTVSIPLLIRVSYPVYPIVVFIVLSLLLIVAILAATRAA